jgi:hypothetical protein
MIVAAAVCVLVTPIIAPNWSYKTFSEEQNASLLKIYDPTIMWVALWFFDVLLAGFSPRCRMGFSPP